jgi:site-specific DNA-cytosine methylase
MKVLCACEKSQEVTNAFRALGHEAYSCDVQATSGNNPEWHFRKDVRKILDGSHSNMKFDLVIAFPPCDDLAVSGARWFHEKRADGRQQKSIDFFMLFTKLDCMWAIENPIGIMSTNYRKPDQIIQPWQFGHGETKATCLWLNGLPLLTPTDIVSGREQKVWKMPPSANRAELRAKTYPGIAQAMAEQWTNYLLNQQS